MKKILALIAVLVMVSLSVIGCQKSEAPKPAEQSSVTTTNALSSPTATAPAAVPAANK